MARADAPWPEISAGRSSSVIMSSGSGTTICWIRLRNSRMVPGHVKGARSRSALGVTPRMALWNCRLALGGEVVGEHQEVLVAAAQGRRLYAVAAEAAGPRPKARPQPPVPSPAHRCSPLPSPPAALPFDYSAACRTETFLVAHRIPECVNSKHGAAVGKEARPPIWPHAAVAMAKAASPLLSVCVAKRPNSGD